MKFLRILLFPFAIIYGFITSIRNFFFDKGILKSTSFDIPVIAVGNLSVGGTGKTPQIEYLIRLLSEKYKIATLSRGYKRKSEGFVLANATSNAEILGDEPFQYFQKFRQIQVAVDANRTNGIQQLLAQKNPPEIILLDDAFQHRKVKADLYILLTAYTDLYCDDFMLPTGNLRESRSGAHRATIVIITKCPPTLSLDEKNKIKAKLKLNSNQQLFFTAINYDDAAFSKSGQIPVAEIQKLDKILLAGIAKPEPFFDYLKKEDDEVMKFPDHHDFSENEISDIITKANNKLIVTTEKDYVRIADKFPEEQLFYLPIKSEFLGNANVFDKSILDFVEQFSTK
ncbi:tetraacyldisaccharide 4'-kinase [Flavobacterium antarcticum]|uniref:tetraacyldisaccharide 4'-kinase n=1 Tax=Flavobacterium antarcticum TaxID=271155 RepID=UPI0003B3193B|nr:tetraacyldisaccharide 4'-kinase [Flavobacterium antarcticum]